METPYIELPLKEFLVALNWFLSLNVIWIFKGTPFAIPCHIVHFAKLCTWSIPSPLTMSSYAKNLNNLLICRICYLLQMMKMFCRLTQYLQLLPAITIIKSSAKKKTIWPPFFIQMGFTKSCATSVVYIIIFIHTFTKFGSCTGLSEI